jgi:hypothetical protein
VRVDLVLQQRGGSGGTSPTGIAGVEDDDLVAVPRQLVGDQRTGDSGAEHRNVATNVTRESRKSRSSPLLIAQKG